MSKKRDLLLEHAERVFYENGFNAVGVKRIVNEANVSLMTLYNHFNTKEDLMLDVLKRREERYFNLLSSAVKKGGKNPALLLAAAHIEWLGMYATNGCMFLRIKEELASDESNEIVQFVIKHKHKLLQFIKELGYDDSQSLRLMLILEGATSLSEFVELDEVANELYYSTEKIFA